MKLKICGLKRPEDIAYANEYQPDYVGFIINFPKSHRNVDLDRLRFLSKEVNPAIKKVGVFVDEPVDSIAKMLEEDLIDIVQLHGNQDEAFIQALRQETDQEIWKAFSIASTEDVAEAKASSADKVLLDQGRGGTGKSFDWSLIQDFDRPYFLAGGMNLETIPQALEKLTPYGIDTSSGAETNKLKDPEKMKNLVRMVKG